MWLRLITYTIVDQAAVINNCFTLIILFHLETVTFLLTDIKIMCECFFEASDNPQ
jgi:hypothetical protein